MTLRRQFLSMALPVAAALVASASALSAQGRPLFQWSGRVDREVQIAMRGRETWTNTGSANERRGRADVETALPRQDGVVRVRIEDGRGDVDVVQQPSARNNYTAVVRIVDRSGGADRYRLSAYWMPSNGSGGWYGGSNGGWDDRRNDRRDDRRGEWERGRDRDDRGRRDDDFGRGRGRVSLLHWSGAVDGDLEIRLREGQVTYRVLNGAGPRDLRVDADSRGMPQRNTDVRIANAQGRGSITVVQQPGAYNAYTTVIRVRDPQGGYGYYNFDLVWR
jgi:hypothetical protein